MAVAYHSALVVIDKNKKRRRPPWRTVKMEVVAAASDVSLRSSISLIGQNGSERNDFVVGH